MFPKSSPSIASVLALLLVTASSCVAAQADPYWQNATVYFLLTDRFANGDPTNDKQFERKQDAAVLRNFMGGDLRGVTQKIEEGYFTNLGVTALWMTPVVEQIHGYWDEDWGRSYPFHGYWILDWTRIDPNFGNKEDFRQLVDSAHRKGIRILADVVVNHTGPKTAIDPAWPDAWIRTRPICDWQGFSGNVDCAIAASLTDIRTDTRAEVELPGFLKEKWQREGRLEEELAKLDAFFEQSQLPRYPQHYIISWLSDWVREYGIDGFRVDTAKHVEPEVWRVLKTQASTAFEEWKKNNPQKRIDDKAFFMMGEVYNFGLLSFRNTKENTRAFDFGDRVVDFYDFGFEALINMGFPSHAQMPMPELFGRYAREYQDGSFADVIAMNYLVSHDDPDPYDKARERAEEAALKLLLAPGAAQIYYGDETARSLEIESAIGDATLRSFMNWQDQENKATQDLLQHWQKIGRFRQRHLSVGAGKHWQHKQTPYVFSRVLNTAEHKDEILVVLNTNTGKKTTSVYQIFAEGETLRDAYSGETATVSDGKITINSPATLLLLEAL